MIDYAELQVTSNYSFLRGASHPDELVIAAAALGYRAIALTDRNSLSGVVRAHVAAKKANMRLVVGARLDFVDGAPSVLCHPTDRAAYGRLCRLLTDGRRRAEKGDCRLAFDDLLAAAEGQMLTLLPPPHWDEDSLRGPLEQLREVAGPNLSLAASHLYRGDDVRRLARLAAFAQANRVPLLATNDAMMHSARRRALQDVLTCIRTGLPINQAGHRLLANAERHLKAPDEIARLFRTQPQALARSLEVAAACRFSLDELRYEYPVDPVPPGSTPQDELVRLTWIGADGRWPDGLPDKVRGQIEHELALIGQLGYAPYFLTVHDIVQFARGRGILCQGRGSAANSAVCYALGITAVDPGRIDVLFERFMSAERDEPPDIDVDFEHERREEVIQYIYGKYGRERAGLTATVITYRTKSAIREVGKVMGLSDDSIAALQSAAWRTPLDDVGPERIREAGLDPEDPTIHRVMGLAEEILGFPRHLSQHTGGFVLTRGPLCEVVPIENAAMEDRTVIQWDKDDLDALGILKIDVLALGMLSCLRRAFGLIERHHGRPLTLASLPQDDEATYEMLCRADSVGVFQVESRAQMSMLPRLRPRCFYDLVIQVAIVRPGPIQGDMVHPYLRRRQGKEIVQYPSAELEGVLGKTLGVPLFQEQAMKIAIVAAGFTPSEADGLRRAMATFRRFGQIHGFRDKFIRGMVGRGYADDFADRCFRQIEGFADYGFPESHAASFALLVYVSAWIKCHYPATFAAALLNSQPMGFYAPAQIVRDARRHGVRVRPVDVNHSDWDNSLEADPQSAGGMALRLGLRQIKGLSQKAAKPLLAARERDGAFDTAAALQRRAGLGAGVMDCLARADAFESLGQDRRGALWTVGGLGEAPLPLFAHAEAQGRETRPEPAVRLPACPPGEAVAEDYRALALSLKAHPMALLRPRIEAAGYLPCERLGTVRSGSRMAVAGLVIGRQRPSGAKGVIFVTLEDETDVANLIVHVPTFEANRQVLLSANLLAVRGRVQRESEVIHLIVDRMEDLTPLLVDLGSIGLVGAPQDQTPLRIASRDFQ